MRIFLGMSVDDWINQFEGLHLHTFVQTECFIYNPSSLFLRVCLLFFALLSSSLSLFSHSFFLTCLLSFSHYVCVFVGRLVLFLLEFFVYVLLCYESSIRPGFFCACRSVACMFVVDH
jgi:hypothetical protein